MIASQCVTPEQECAEPKFKLLDPLAACIRPGHGASVNERRGLAIAKTPGMMRRMDDGAYGVRSGRSYRWYAVTRSESQWECTCTFFVRRNVYCKHICAVEAQVIPRDSKVGTVAAVLALIADGMCPRCRTAARRDGMRRNRCGDKQRYRCTGCGLAVLGGVWVRVAEDTARPRGGGVGHQNLKMYSSIVLRDGFLGMPDAYPHAHFQVLDMYTAGMSLRRIACNIGQGIKDPKNPHHTVSYQAVHRFITRFARGSGAFEDLLHPHVSEK